MIYIKCNKIRKFVHFLEEMRVRWLKNVKQREYLKIKRLTKKIFCKFRKNSFYNPNLFLPFCSKMFKYKNLIKLSIGHAFFGIKQLKTPKQYINCKQIFGIKIEVTHTLSCLKEASIRNSRKTRLQDAKFWKTFGIFFSATRRLSRGSVTDLKIKKIKKSNLQLICKTVPHNPKSTITNRAIRLQPLLRWCAKTVRIWRCCGRVIEVVAVRHTVRYMLGLLMKVIMLARE